MTALTAKTTRLLSMRKRYNNYSMMRRWLCRRLLGKTTQKHSGDSLKFVLVTSCLFQFCIALWLIIPQYTTSSFNYLLIHQPDFVENKQYY
uniref:Uncharacterized protein n=1 Tax=Arion vulgaris TaxID=1028688 RepID=A0A0B7ARI2_9EUPU